MLLNETQFNLNQWSYNIRMEGAYSMLIIFWIDSEIKTYNSEW